MWFVITKLAADRLYPSGEDGINKEVATLFEYKKNEAVNQVC